MTPQEFEAHHLRRPFNPFAIHLNDGSHYEVPTPEFVAHPRGARHILVADIRGAGHAVIDLAHVNRVAFADPALVPESQGAI